MNLPSGGASNPHQIQRKLETPALASMHSIGNPKGLSYSGLEILAIVMWLRMSNSPKTCQRLNVFWEMSQPDSLLLWTISHPENRALQKLLTIVEVIDDGFFGGDRWQKYPVLPPPSGGATFFGDVVLPRQAFALGPGIAFDGVKDKHPSPGVAEGIEAIPV